MNFSILFLLLVIVFVLGAVACYFFMREKNDAEKVLSQIFGKPTHASTLTFTEVKEWVRERRKYIDDGAKVVVTKATNDTLRNLTAELKIDIKKAGNFLVIAVMKQTPEKDIMIDSALIKYQELDEQLENVLAPGDGTLIIED